MVALNGYDIAGVNGPGIITTALTGGFVICKASEGQSFFDPLHDTFVAKARAAGKLVGHYHYGRPDTKDTSDAVKEADHFIASAKAKPGDTMWLDFERSETVDQRVAWPEWVIAFTARVWSVTGASCGVYLNDWFANRVLENATAAQAATIRSLPLWKAGNNNVYVSDPTVGAGNIHGWQVLTCWQWTDKQGSLGIDRDIFYGDASTWTALGVGAPAQEDDMQLTDRFTVTAADGKSTEEISFATFLNRANWTYQETLRQKDVLEQIAADVVTIKDNPSGVSAAALADELAKRLEA